MDLPNIFILVPIISNTEEDINVHAEDFDHFVPRFSLSNNDFMLISEDSTVGPKLEQPVLSQSLKVKIIKKLAYYNYTKNTITYKLISDACPNF